MHSDLLQKLGISPNGNPAYSTGILSGGIENELRIRKTSPIDGSFLAEVPVSNSGDVDLVLTSAHQTFMSWRNVPAPVRGETVRLIGQKLRERKIKAIKW